MSSVVEPQVECSPTAAGYAISDEAAGLITTALKALAEPLRLRFLSYIAATPGGEACVCDLAELTNVSQPTVSHHLKVLKNAGILTSERRGTWVWYRIIPELHPAITTLLDAFAPATASAALPAATTKLSDVDGGLTHAAESLRRAFPALSEDLVLRTVRESYTALARNATVTSHLTTLTERFARQRLTDISRSDKTVPQVLFVCVANAGRSQLAAALVNHYAQGRVIARSAGSRPARDIHPNVRILLDELDAADSAEAFPKPLTDDAVRAADVVVTMGCGDVCPVIPGVRYEDWAVGDPALASEIGAKAIRDDIATRVRALVNELTPNLLLKKTGENS